MLERAAVAESDQNRPLRRGPQDRFIAANKLDAEDPEPLLDFYQAYVRAGRAADGERDRRLALCVAISRRKMSASG